MEEQEKIKDKKTIVQFTITPLGEGISVSRFVVEALKVVEKSGLKYNLTPMSTIFETDSIEDAIDVILKSHEAVFNAGASRVVTDIKIDDRRDVSRTMEMKVDDVKRELEDKK